MKNIVINDIRCRKIMGRNFISPIEVARGMGFIYKPDELEVLNQVDVPEEILITHRGGHFLAPGFPISTGSVCSMIPNLLSLALWQPGYIEQDFWQEEVDLSWYLMRMTIIPGSTGLSFSDQLKLPGKGKELPRLCEAVYLTGLYHQLRGDDRLRNIRNKATDWQGRLFRNILIATQSEAAVIEDECGKRIGGPMAVGYFNRHGLTLIDSDRCGEKEVGVAPIRKFTQGG